MGAPTLDDLPPPPPFRKGWPWSEGSTPLADRLPDGNPWPKISVITPSLNQGRFIEETIRSVLLQGYPDLEYIVVDGGSEDQSLEIIRHYEPWLACWMSEADRGQAHAVNKGFRLATGGIVAWLNSDDLYFPNALQHAALAFHSCPEAVMVYGSGKKIDSTGTALKEISHREYDPNLLRTRYYMLQQSSFFHRKALHEAGLLDESIHYFMDWELTLRLSQKGRIVSIAQPLGMFRIHPFAKTQRAGWERYREIARIGRRYNGWKDKNAIAYRLLQFSRWLHERTPVDRKDRLGRFLRFSLDRVFKRDTYMIH